MARAIRGAGWGAGILGVVGIALGLILLSIGTGLAIAAAMLLDDGLPHSALVLVAACNSQIAAMQGRLVLLAIVAVAAMGDRDQRTVDQ